MAYIVLAIYLIVIGLRMTIGLNLPPWLIALLSLAAGILLLAQKFGWTVKRKD